MNTKPWYLYIVAGKNGMLYTGITVDIVRRVEEHNNNNIKGAKSLRSKRPVKLVYTEKYDNQNQARIREAQIKKWNRTYKVRLIEDKTKLSIYL